MTDVEAVKRGLTAKPPKAKPDYLSTGSTLINLALTGHPQRGFRKGRYYFLVGDSSSGKTFLARTCLAEAANNPAFDGYRLIDDDVERGAMMDFHRFFGSKMASRVEPPRRDSDGSPVYSETIEDFYFHVDDAIKAGQPFVYVLDSMDALTSKYEGEKFEEKKKAARKGTKAKGDYGDGKAKINSSGIRTLMGKLDRMGSILLVINQTRDNINAGPFEPQQTRSGGRALTFYAAAELWSSMGGQIKKTIKDKPRVIGVKSRIKIKKNRINGRNRTVDVPIYYSVGIADLDSCVDYLVAEGHWEGTEAKVNAPEYEFKGSREKLIRKLEEEGLEDDLRELVGEVWAEVEAACEVQRKSRYE